MESTWRRRTAGHSVEAGLAGGQRPCSCAVSTVARRGIAAQPMETCQDHPAQEARQGRLHHCKSLEADLTASHAGQSAGVGGGRENLAHGRDAWVAAHQPLRSAQAAISGTSTGAPPRTNLHRVAGPANCQPDQLRRQGGVQRSVQGKTAAEDESARHTREAVAVGRGVLLTAHRIDPGQRTGVRGSRAASGRSAARVASVSHSFSLLQC